jgi:hypothetical protein
LQGFPAWVVIEVADARIQLMEGFEPGTIQLPFRDRSEAADAVDVLASQGWDTRLVEWRDGWWIASIDGPRARIEEQRKRLMAAYHEANANPELWRKAEPPDPQPQNS